MNRMPAWIGWPATGPAPGDDWLPGPRLRSIIVFLVIAFLALALTVDYAASISFFALALIGIYVGLRRGFVNGLTKAEKGLMIAFSGFPAVAIFSYAVGTESNVGFHLLGRELKFFLFIPVYLSLRWSFPKRFHVGLALTCGAGLAAISSIITWSSTTAAMKAVGSHLPAGATSTHITFGGLALLFAAIGALFTHKRSRSWARNYALPIVGMSAGIVASILSLARGAWLAFPLLTIITVFWLRRNGIKCRNIILFLCLTGIGGSLLFVAQPTLRNRVMESLNFSGGHFSIATNTESFNTCPNNANFLSAYVKIIRQPQGQHGDEAFVKRIGNLPARWNKICKGGNAIVLRAGSTGHHAFFFELRRVGFHGYKQYYQVLAKGHGTLWMWTPSKSNTLASRKWSLARAASESQEPGVPAVWSVPPGHQLTFIPLQYPRQVGGYNLPLTEGSTSDRLRMWRFASKLFTGHPIVGTGVGSYRKLAKNASLTGDKDAVIARQFEHPHSGYLNNLYGGGLLLFTCYLLLLFAPALATRSISGFTISSMMAIFCITESMFMHSFVIYSYIIMTVLICTDIYHARPQC